MSQWPPPRVCGSCTYKAVAGVTLDADAKTASYASVCTFGTATFDGPAGVLHQLQALADQCQQHGATSYCVACKRMTWLRRQASTRSLAQDTMQCMLQARRAAAVSTARDIMAKANMPVVRRMKSKKVQKVQKRA